MFGLGRAKNLSTEALKSIEKRVIAASDNADEEAAWQQLQPLLAVQKQQRQAAVCLLRLVEGRKVAFSRAIEILVQIHATHAQDNMHAQDKKMLGLIGEALEGARDLDDLNAPPPDHPLFQQVVDSLAGIAQNCRGLESEEKILSGLATAARMMGRQRDDIAQRSYQRLTELDPHYSAYHYNLGLFYKTRGRFSAGMAANQNALNLVDDPSQSIAWNLGICATGAGEGAVALDVWQKMGNKIEMGRFGLPEGGYPDCKVRLAQRPLAERSADEDTPGREETIWIERLSPCHGIVRSVLYQDLGVDYGDVVLVDGAPITFHKYGDTEVPVFPHLATLIRNNYSFYDFAGTQDLAGRIHGASEDLGGDAVIYSHTENFKVLCANCWRSPEVDHKHGEAVEKHVVTGRIAAPSHIAPDELLNQLDNAFAGKQPCRIYVPELCQAAGRVERVPFEKRRFAMLIEQDSGKQHLL
jgi:tetratricopeptide (TPR) repeat protein